MSRPFTFRVCLVASLLILAVAMATGGVRAQSPYSGPRFETSWRCSKCGGYLGNGVSPPTYCHHCKSELRGTQFDWMSRPSGNRPETSKPAAKSKAGTPLAAIAIGGVVVLALIGLAFYIFTSSDQTSRPR